MSKLTDTLYTLLGAATVIAVGAGCVASYQALRGGESFVRGAIFAVVLLAMWGVVIGLRAAWRASRRVGTTTVKRVSQALKTTRDA